MATKQDCVRCDQEIKGHGHNGYPLAHGLVCDECNKDVIALRLKHM